jgi:predicted N-acetyltransferase YhbS
MSPHLVVRKAQPQDIADISRLHGRVFGPGRFARSAYRVREGKGHLSRYCLVAELRGELVASLRITEIIIGGRAGAALLGPVAVDPEHRGHGLGTKLMTEALAAARAGGTALVVLVGDDPYYGRFGFKAVPAGQIVFPGPVNPARILACELKDGAVTEYRGTIVAIPSNGEHG